MLVCAGHGRRCYGRVRGDPAMLRGDPEAVEDDTRCYRGVCAATIQPRPDALRHGRLAAAPDFDGPVNMLPDDRDRSLPITGRPAFVLHEHRRPRHHFDLRLQERGVLRSWALPKGLPQPGENRLAVEVADHDLDHLVYEDPDKSIADIGWWEEHDRNQRRMIFTLHGRHDPRRYVLIRTSRDWLLRQTKDQPPAEPSPPDTPA